MHPIRSFASFCLLMLLAVPTSHAQLATGNWTPTYGAPLATQTTQSTGKFEGGSRAASGAYELDAAYGYIDGVALHLLLTGNLVLAWNIEGTIVSSPVELFLDTRDGGQGQLLANNPVVIPYAYDLTLFTGLRFDSGFVPDWWFSVGGSSNHTADLWVRAAMAELATAGGGTGADLGEVHERASAALTGGVNPHGISVAVNDSNTVGVTLGCAAWSGPEIRSGIEWVIPLAAIGSPTGCIRACAFDPTQLDYSRISNQVLGPVPPGTCDLGPASAVDFAAIPGAQWFTICPLSTPARAHTWGAIKALYR